MDAREYFEKGQEAFVNTLGGDHTAFQRSLALIEGERLPMTEELSELEMERLRRWMQPNPLSHLQCPGSADN
ncbi:MAG: hypothetical protein GVY02_00100 [Bacteroidetes bacterium]|jgi:hypothetical protein|nr:hypothetical protein [Bacteroidota bacterium]